VLPAPGDNQHYLLTQEKFMFGYDKGAGATDIGNKSLVVSIICGEKSQLAVKGTWILP